MTGDKATNITRKTRHAMQSTSNWDKAMTGDETNMGKGTPASSDNTSVIFFVEKEELRNHHRATFKKKAIANEEAVAKSITALELAAGILTCRMMGTLSQIVFGRRNIP